MRKLEYRTAGRTPINSSLDIAGVDLGYLQAPAAAVVGYEREWMRLGMFGK